MKEPLRKVLGKALLSYQELATVLTRIEAVINSRPLTTVSDDVRDLLPITPAHLALGRSLYSLPDVQHTKVRRGSDTCISRSFLPISGRAGEDSTCISYHSVISGCVDSQPSRSETYC